MLCRGTGSGAGGWEPAHDTRECRPDGLGKWCGGAAVERLTAHERQSALTGSARDERRKERWLYLQV